MGFEPAPATVAIIAIAVVTHFDVVFIHIVREIIYVCMYVCMAPSDIRAMSKLRSAMVSLSVRISHVSRCRFVRQSAFGQRLGEFRGDPAEEIGELGCKYMAQ